MQPGCCGEHSSCSRDPIDRLVAEHGIVSMGVDAMAREIDGMRVGGEIRPAFWQRALEFCERYVDRAHHRKEERVLFPLLQAAGLSEQHGALHGLATQHDQGRAALAGIRAALAGGGRDELVRAVDGYVALVCGHVDAENRMLFPLVHELLDGKGMQRVTEQFAAFDAGPDGMSQERGRQAAAALEADAGTTVAM